MKKGFFKALLPVERTAAVGCVVVALAIVAVQCRNTPGAKVVTQIQDSTKAITEGAKYILENSPVVAASHLSQAAKAALETLQGIQMPAGSLGDQFRTFIAEGEYDFGEVFKFIDLRFEGKTAEINPKFAHEIDHFIQVMKAYPTMYVKMESYTDSDGTEKFNEKLTLDRAMAIKNQMTKAGIDPERIEVKAYGEKYPVAHNDTPEGRSINNRIEITIKKM